MEWTAGLASKGFDAAVSRLDQSTLMTKRLSIEPTKFRVESNASISSNDEMAKLSLRRSLHAVTWCRNRDDKSATYVYRLLNQEHHMGIILVHFTEAQSSDSFTLRTTTNAREEQDTDSADQHQNRRIECHRETNCSSYCTTPIARKEENSP